MEFFRNRSIGPFRATVSKSQSTIGDSLHANAHTFVVGIRKRNRTRNRLNIGSGHAVERIYFPAVLKHNVIQEVWPRTLPKWKCTSKFLPLVVWLIATLTSLKRDVIRADPVRRCSGKGCQYQFPKAEEETSTDRSAWKRKMRCSSLSLEEGT